MPQHLWLGVEMIASLRVQAGVPPEAGWLVMEGLLPEVDLEGKDGRFREMEDAFQAV